MPKKVSGFEAPVVLQQVLAPFVVRRPRSVVTRRGKQARGYFASAKAEGARFESLGENRLLEVLEVAPSVTWFQTHPAQLRIGVGRGNSSFWYTPDVAFRVNDRGVVVAEFKPADKMADPKVSDRLMKVGVAFGRTGVLFIVVMDTDLKSPGSDPELVSQTLRTGPLRGRGGGDRHAGTRG